MINILFFDDEPFISLIIENLNRNYDWPFEKDITYVSDTRNVIKEDCYESLNIPIN